MRKALLTLVCTLGLSACAAPDTQQACNAAAPLADVTYQCDNGQTVRVKWWSDTVEVTRGHETWCLAHARSASGARYSDGTREAWEHQGELRITDATGTVTLCRKVTAE